MMITKLWIYFMPLNCTLTKGWNDKLCIFYHNKKNEEGQRNAYKCICVWG